RAGPSTPLRVSGPVVGARKRRAVRRGAWTALAVVALLTLLSSLPALAQDAAKEPAYRAFPLIGSRLAVWAVAQLHLNFAAFILGVPIFAVIIQAIGWRPGDAPDRSPSPEPRNTPLPAV